MKQSILALSLAASLASLASPALAGGPVPYPAATEFTQLANNAQLVLAYKKQIEQFILQAKQYEAQLQQLKKMSPSKLGKMLVGIDGQNVGDDVDRQISVIRDLSQSMADLQSSTDVLAREGSIAQSTIELLRKRGINISPNEYLSGFAALAKAKGDVYAQRYTALQQAADSAASDVQRIKVLAETAPEIESNIQGFSSLLQANTIMSGQLAGLRQALVVAAQTQTEQARVLSDQDAREKASSAYVQQVLMNANRVPDGVQ